MNCISFLFLALLALPFQTLAQVPAQQLIQSQHLFPFRSRINGQIGYINQIGQVVIPPRFGPKRKEFIDRFLGEDDDDEMQEPGPQFFEGLAVICTERKCGFINKTGRVVIKPRFMMADDFSGGLAPIGLKMAKAGELDMFDEGVRYGFIDRAGKVVIAPRFNEVAGFSEGLCRVTVGKKNYFINQKGQFVIGPILGYVESFSDGVALVGVSKKPWKYIDKRGKTVLEFNATRATSFYHGLAIVQVGKKFGLIDKKGAYFVQPTYDDLSFFSGGLAVVKINGRYGYISESGQVAIPAKFDKAESFSGGLAVVKIDGKYGYISESGKVAIPAKFDKAESFSDGLALVLLEKKQIDNDGLLRVRKRYGYIDRQGVVVYKWVTGADLVRLPRKNGPSPLIEVEPQKVSVTIETTPSKAKVYLVPLDVWDDDNNIINSDKRLFEWRRGSDTPYKEDVYQEVYMVVLVSDHWRIPRKLDANPSNNNKLIVDLRRER